MTVRGLFERQFKLQSWKTSGESVQWRFNDKHTLLEFQATANPKLDRFSDWLHNVNVYPRKFENYRACAGLVDLFTSSYPEVVNGYIFNPDRAPMLFTGYSHGGMLATLYFLFFGHPGDYLITFAAPSVLWGRVPEVFAVNYVLRGDLLAEILPTWLGFRKLGTIDYIGPESRLCLANHEPEAYLEHLPLIELPVNI